MGVWPFSSMEPGGHPPTSLLLFIYRSESSSQRRMSISPPPFYSEAQRDKEACPRFLHLLVAEPLLFCPIYHSTYVAIITVVSEYLTVCHGFYPHSTPRAREVLSPLYRWGTAAQGRLSELTKVTQKSYSSAGDRTKVSCITGQSLLARAAFCLCCCQG